MKDKVIQFNMYSFQNECSHFFYFFPNFILMNKISMNKDGPGCITIGILNVFTSFAYFTNINLYSLEQLGILSSKFINNYKLRHLAIVSGSSFLALLAYLSNAIGFNKNGTCSLLPGMYLQYSCQFLFQLHLLQLFGLVLVIFLKYINSQIKRSFGKRFDFSHLRQKYKVNLICIITFLIIRIVPMLILTIISLADTNKKSYTIAFYSLAIPMSLGGVCLKPTIQDYLNKKLQKQKSGIAELSLPKVEVRALSSMTNITRESSIVKTHYLSYIQGTTRDNSVAQRKTCLDNEELVAKLTSELENNQIKLKLNEFLVIFKIIREMNNDFIITRITTNLTHYHMKHMRQSILYFDNDTSFNASEIICTSYAESQLNQNIVEQLQHSRLKLQTNSFTTYDGEVLIYIINNQAKRYLIRHLLQAIYNSNILTQQSFIPPMLGLYSIVNQSNQYTIIIQKNLLNSIMLEQQGFSIQGFFTYQVGQIDEEIKGGQDISSKMKMNPKIKQEFLNTLNQDLIILRDQYLWAFSFNLIHMEAENPINILPNMNKTRNGYLIASLGGILDQFLISSNEASANPKLYASQLAQQIDLLL
ncbi:unnamed protein product [Paramecium sonneborni]|uniref:PIPK domain-containing protein n=1 Tax=Paramecium sonneborni TaxID=65129 RepID=A0A8S1R853_9CILI|nr:unnamed protein product [Paramecium sonneborni]